MRPSRPFAALPPLPMPLRDALRGLSTVADATGEALEPAATLLPPPLRNHVRSMLDSAAAVGRRLMTAPVGEGDIRVAAAVARGEARDGASLRRCAMVVGYAWDHLRRTGPDPHHLVSETILADSLSRLPEGARGAEHAALLVRAVRRRAAIGPLPGVVAESGQGGEEGADLRLVAIVVWLLSERGGSPAEEETLLDLASALVSAIPDEARDALADGAGDRTALARLLDNAAAHL